MVLLDEKNNEMGVSRKAAAVGISAVILSRIAMAIPGMSKASAKVETGYHNDYLYLSLQP